MPCSQGPILFRSLSSPVGLFVADSDEVLRVFVGKIVMLEASSYYAGPSPNWLSDHPAFILSNKT